MVELELLGANGDTVVMADADGERYTLVIDDALRAAVRRDRAAILPQLSTTSSTVGIGGATNSVSLRPRELQALMRAGATAAEVAASTGMKVDHIRRFEGPVLAERQWAVSQAQGCRIGWERDSPLLGELVVDRLATRGVDPTCLEWDAVREGREPWLIVVTFIQAAEEKQARWTLDLSTPAVHALDDEARWLTEAASLPQGPAVFDQDSPARGAYAPQHTLSAASARSANSATSAPLAGTPAPRPPQAPSFDDPPALNIPGLPSSAQTSTDAILADLNSTRGRRVAAQMPIEDDFDDTVDANLINTSSATGSAGASSEAAATKPKGATEPEPTTLTSGIRAQVFSMSERRRRGAKNHPAGSRREAGTAGSNVPTTAVPTASTGVPRQMQLPTAPAAPSVPAPAPPPAPPAEAEPTTEPVAQVAPVTPAARQGRGGTRQSPPPPVPPKATKKRSPKRRAKLPEWDDIVFGSKPE